MADNVQNDNPMTNGSLPPPDMEGIEPWLVQLGDAMARDSAIYRKLAAERDIPLNEFLLLVAIARLTAAAREAWYLTDLMQRVYSRPAEPWEKPDGG